MRNVFGDPDTDQHPIFKVLHFDIDLQVAERQVVDNLKGQHFDVFQKSTTWRSAPWRSEK
jgi:hypothetical protein